MGNASTTEVVSIPVRPAPPSVIHPKQRLKELSKLVTGSGHLYQVPLIEEPFRLKNHFTVGEPSRAPEKVMLLMGRTGVGKTTTANWLLNFIYGVELDDQFRFQLIKPGTDSKSDTQEVRVYTIYHQEGMKIPYTLTIVDTPGFLSTGSDAMAELGSDQRTRKQLEDYFGINKGDDEVNDIHAVCIVVKATDVRLGAAEQYAFDCITQIFGKNIKDNIVIFFTFAASRSQAQAEKVVRDAGVPCSMFFPFNNDDILSLPDDQSEDQQIPSMWWGKGEIQSSKFFQFMSSLRGRTSKLTKQTLGERRKVTLAVRSVEEQIRSKLNELQTLSDLEQVVRDNARAINADLDFKVMVEKEFLEMEPIIDSGSKAMNCRVCRYTCHYPCTTGGRNKQCIAFQLGTKCQCCPGKCSINDHGTDSFTYERVLRKLERSSKDLIRELAVGFDNILESPSRAENISRATHPKVAEALKKVVEKVVEIDKSLEKLEGVALVKEPQDASDYIDILIEKERGRGAKGYMNRIQQLEKVKREYELLVGIVRASMTPR